MTKVVLFNNSDRCFSDFVISRFEEATGLKVPGDAHITIARHDPVLVQVVEESGSYSQGREFVENLKVVEIDGDKYIIREGYYCEEVFTPKTTEWIDATEYTSKASMVDLAVELDTGERLEMYGHKAGFKVTLKNGNVVSVAWVPNCYCERRHHQWDIYSESVAPKGYDSEDAEVMITGPGDERHYFPDSYETVMGWQSPEQVRELIKWASENEVVPKPELPAWGELEKLVDAVKAEISDEYRASEDEDDEPGIQLTVGWNGRKEWSFQTGDNSFTGGAYGYQHWAVVSVYRDTKSDDLAVDIRDQLEEVSA